MDEIKCKLCEKIFKSKNGLVKHLTFSHKFDTLQIKKYYDDYLKNKEESICNICGKETEYFNFIKGYLDFCPYCKNRIFRKQCIEYWIYHHNQNIDQAKESVKIYQTELGDKNKNKDSILLKEKSHWCKEYWIKKGYSEEESIKIVSENNRNLSSRNNHISHNGSLDYWLKKGYSEEEANIKIKNWKLNLSFSLSKDGFIYRYGKIQGSELYEQFCETRRHTKQFFIDKYGRENGLIRYNKYTDRCAANFSKINIKSWSYISQILFWDIYNNMDINLTYYFGTFNNGIRDESINNEFRVYYSKNRHFKLDFYIPELNKCIEYNCKFWHNTIYDDNRNKIIKQKIPGIQILDIDDESYSQNSKMILEQCINFLKG